MRMINRALVVLSAVLSMVVMGACEKSEGEGGNSSISGRIIEQGMVSPCSDEIEAEYPVAEQRVYIIYGDESEVYHDDMRTDFEGRYKFRWLRPGTYTLFVISECSTCDSETGQDCLNSGGQSTVKRSVTIDKSEDAVLDDMVIQNY